jgi:outer membrane protein
MKTYAIRKAVFLCLVLFVYSEALYAAEVRVHLENTPPTGTAIFMLFDSANAFGDFRDPAMMVKHLLDNRGHYLIENVPHGTYALLVYYDENGNDRLDRNFIGIPKEMLGFSNNYEPKGPPSFSRAAFLLTEGELRSLDVKLYRPLGKWGTMGLGLGVIARSSPYRDYNAGVFQVIPAITYNGERLQIFGPSVQLSILGSGKIRLATTGKYRIGVYDEDESDFLEGMGDRESTFMAGLALLAELPKGVELTIGYEHDVLDEIGGGTARFGLEKSFQFSVFRFSPDIGLNWTSSKIANYDFGVPKDKETIERPAYDLDDTVSFEASLGLFIDISRNWMMVVNVKSEFLGEEVTDSPIVTDDYVIKGFSAINYVF